jgi:hypothetical protein
MSKHTAARLLWQAGEEGLDLPEISSNFHNNVTKQ